MWKLGRTLPRALNAGAAARSYKTVASIPAQYAKLHGMEPWFQMPAPDAITAERVMCKDLVVRPDAHGGDGCYALRNFKKGECVEWGVVRRMVMDGNANPFVFTWSEDRTVWATAGGMAMFYNTHPTDPNTEMIRYFDEDRFEIYALRDIAAGEELTHTYRSLKWRTCFVAQSGDGTIKS
jgi:hypothetical protein